MKAEAKTQNSETPLLMVWITIGTILLSLTGVKACGAPYEQRQGWINSVSASEERTPTGPMRAPESFAPKLCTEG
jgi:hypothetical protein